MTDNTDNIGKTADNTDGAAGQVIGQAGVIIDRFGGIRPMSAKTGIPVTTIQGWKKRDAIPLARVREIKNAALLHGVDVESLLESSPENNNMPRNLFGATPDTTPNNYRVVAIGAGVALTLALIIAAVFAVAPEVKKVSDQERRITELEQQLVVMKQQKEEQQQVQAPLISVDIQEKLVGLQGKVAELSEQARTYTAAVEDLQTGTMMERLNKLEGHVGHLLQDANAQGLQNMLSKVQSLQNSPEGNASLEAIMGTFAGALGADSNGTEKTPDQVTEVFEKLRQSDPKIAETFKDVAPEDMRAAVMLVGMSQLRSSLARDNQSFDSDLQILKSTAAKDDPKLQEAIDRLAPKAKSGILTPDGLSKQLRGLTGEIVEASLKGEEVSIEDKALARFGDIVKVEKNGKVVSGTDTQQRVAEAQKLLDAGDVAGAVTILNGLQGPAAEKAAPLIDSAQATMMAEQVQNLLGQNILSKLKGITRKSTPYTAGGGGIGEILKPMQGNTPTINIPMPQQNMPSLSIEQSGGGE
jgi:hypothetical protein